MSWVIVEFHIQSWGMCTTSMDSEYYELPRQEGGFFFPEIVGLDLDLVPCSRPKFSGQKFWWQSSVNFIGPSRTVVPFVQDAYNLTIAYKLFFASVDPSAKACSISKSCKLPPSAKYVCQYPWFEFASESKWWGAYQHVAEGGIFGNRILI